MDPTASFCFVTCQVGAEAAVKAELARGRPLFRLAFSRPGFLTFKMPAPGEPPDEPLPALMFARAHGVAIGKVQGLGLDDMAAGVWKLAGGRRFDSLHVWQRDTAPPGAHGFHPGMTDLAREAERAIRLCGPPAGAVTSDDQTSPLPRRQTRRNDLVLDVVLVEANLWWVGYHRANDVVACWPGGLAPLELPVEAVSRAYVKMEEALLWSQLPIEAGQRVVEIGSAPGGASQSLLRHGLLVTGIDPAAMHAEVLAHPNFTHVRKRGADVRRREFRKTRWLTADMNVAPGYTLDTVEAIVTHPEVNIRGMLLTLKLIDWDLADEIPSYLERIRGWGFAEVRARQLQHNRQDICVAALRSASLRQAGRKRQRRPASSGRRNTPA